jgi:hypothetical protein
MAHKQPGAGKDLLLLLLIDRLIDKDFATNVAMFRFDQVLY